MSPFAFYDAFRFLLDEIRFILWAKESRVIVFQSSCRLEGYWLTRSKFPLMIKVFHQGIHVWKNGTANRPLFACFPRTGGGGDAMIY
jgi:hypothetical protein